MRVVRIEKQVYLQARSEEVLDRRIGTFARALEVRSGRIVSLERGLSAQHGRAAMIRYELPVDSLPALTLGIHTLPTLGSAAERSAPRLHGPSVDTRAEVERVPSEQAPAS